MYCRWLMVLYSLPALGVDWKWLYMYKKRHLGGGGGVKINTAVDEDIECQYLYQIKKGFIKRLKIEKVKWHLQNLFSRSFLSHTVSRSFWQTNMWKIELWSWHVQEPQAPSWVNLSSDDFLPQFRSHMSDMQETLQETCGLLDQTLSWKKCLYNVEWYSVLALQT